jgi:hypothetical protein
MPKLITADTLIGDILHKWIVKEYEQYDRPKAWYIIIGGLCIALIVFAMITGNFLFALVIILAAIILYMQSRQKAPDVPIGITSLGIIINNRFYSYSECLSFYIIYEPPHIKTLYIDTKSPVRPTLRLPLNDVNPIEIRAALRKVLPEDLEKEEEPASDSFARKWMLH